MTRRARVLAGAAALLAGAAGGGMVVVSGAKEAAPAALDAPPSTATVEHGALSSMVVVDGTLTHRAQPDGSPYSAINRAGGTYTELPEEGARIACGEALYRVDDEPVLLLCGTVPAYRDVGMGDRGRDVRQLNRNLHGLGYDADAGDDVFTWRTQAALRTLQEDKGLDETGALDVDDAVFLPRSGRIAEVAGTLGGPARPGTQVVQLTSDALEVHVELEATQQGEVREGDRARITLPSNRTVEGTVDRLGKVARTAAKDDPAAAATIPASIGLDDPRKARGLDRAPVRVSIRTEGVRSALSVPVTALVGKPGGGFAVEVVHDGGRRELVAVKLGLFDTANGRVAVAGDLVEGDRVVVPSP